MTSVNPPEGFVLVTEDDPDIRELIMSQFRREHVAVGAAASVAEAEAVVGERAVDLLILDLSLPDGDGVDLCRRLRAKGFPGSIMMVTARDAAIDRVLGLELGADDYLTKPFEPRELIARARNLLRRRVAAEPRRPTARIARFGPWQLDLHQRRLRASDGSLVLLSSAEFRLLTRFLDAPNRVLTREELLPERSATVAFDRSTDVQISRLRHKLALEPGGEELILTVRNEGYVLPGPVLFE